ncbi:energy-coupling factor transporter ATPase [Phocicoccus pinnipedialis]|uniref:Energy-coupling factor transporter ATP-binding protein EcfA2 n=1 Tax=Phocicoccus pinnipedialis TaxID=110845 RepID=A0A6V7R596_9BACL|nr:energy-coupling factor transporter ATPase [Jeotgalicoccus pinnipedialis]MBP1939841.1 energy-coupling factor transport system ATP-binding protein [Jeotgalicoccus pinnipedialis]CAD2072551.1 Energy-coupling factor transporter ATP-binding protein EcfA2 [Jeotgalicoccus pinnipedialis]
MNILIDDVSVTYQPKTPFQYHALKNISTEFRTGKFYGIVGQTGSGKSTLVQLLNGLILPTTGTVKIDDLELKRRTKYKMIHEVRKYIGIVFQFPEHQLFEETVLKDVMFGPMNMGVSEKDAQTRALHYLNELHVDPALYEKSPFDLSGGQMRKVALAGILAMEPKVLILDEPTAGLDPSSHKETMELFKRLREELKLTIILVTHDMNDVFEYSDEVRILEAGRIVESGPTEDILTDQKLLERYSLNLPDVVRLSHDLIRKGHTIDKIPKSIDEFIVEWRLRDA